MWWTAISEASKQDALKILTIALHCTTKIPALRPSMRMVVQMLEEAVPFWLTAIFVGKEGRSSLISKQFYDTTMVLHPCPMW